MSKSWISLQAAGPEDDPDGWSVAVFEIDREDEPDPELVHQEITMTRAELQEAYKRFRTWATQQVGVTGTIER